MVEAVSILVLAKSVLKQLDFLTSNEFLLGENVVRYLKNIELTIHDITNFVQDAERKESTSSAVKDWLSRLRAILYHADDLFDVIATRAFRKEERCGNTFTKEVRLFFSKSNLLGFVFRTAHDVKHIKERLDDISRDMGMFNFMSNPIEENPVRIPNRRETCSFVRAEDVIGRDKEREEIINLLLSEDHQGEKVHAWTPSVISIVGFSGLGKTALAQLVYNDERVLVGFDLRFWASINYFSDLWEVLIALLQDYHRSDLQHKDLDQLQSLLRKLIMGKKYLLVLDDVYDESSWNFRELETILRCGKSGSMVLATVSNVVVARCLNSIPYKLSVLSEESALSLFEKIAFDKGDQLSNYSELEPIGKRIVRQIGGIPNAIVTVSSLLNVKPKEKEAWLSLLGDIKDHITSPMKLSYNHLHPGLMCCFAYCSIFPKDYTFDKDELVRLWLAQGFIESSGGMDLQELEDACLDRLVERGFLDVVEIYTRTNCLGHKVRLPEFLHALATEVAGGVCECLFEEDVKYMDRYNTLRHVSIHCDPNLFFDHVDLPSLSTTLRTLLFRNTQQFKTDFLNSFLESCRVLRTLQLSQLNIKRLPDLLGELIHLRYLDLSYNWNVEALPNSICDLYHLQTLKLEGCVSLKELPSKFRKLVSLRHLLLDKCNSLASLPSGLAALCSLVTLDRLIVHHHDGGLRYLNSLDNLRGGLTVEIPAEGWLNCIQDANDSNMSRKMSLEWMSICWIKSKADSAHIIAKNEAREVLNKLKPHDRLEYINIDGYVGDALSSWIFSLQNVKQLFLTNCTSEYLLDTVGSVTCPSLETLEMNSLTDLKGWWRNNDQNSKVHLPRVSKVVIKNCPTLVESMPSFPGIETLHLLGVDVKLVEMLLTQNACLSASSSSSALSCLSDSKLEELQLYRVEGLSCLPSGHIKHLTALKRLSISGCNQLDWVSCGGLAQLTALETLSISDCGTVSLEDKGNDTVEDDLGMSWKALKQLRDLTVPWQSHLREGLRYLTALERLEINYRYSSQVETDNAEIERIGIWWKGLESLRKVKVGFGDEMKSCFPRWIQYLPFLEDVEFCNCKELSLCWKTLMIKMRLLKLNFTKVEMVTIVEEEEVEETPLNRPSSLKELYVSMTNEEKWIHSIPWKHFTSLRTLSLHDMPNFKSLPSGIQPLTSLQQLICCDCSPKLKIRCTQNGADWPLISGISDFDIRGATVEKPPVLNSDHPQPPVLKSDHPQPLLSYSHYLCSSCFQPPQNENPTMLADTETGLSRIISKKREEMIV